jgi:putative flavoprotein involved in K+ transport
MTTSSSYDVIIIGAGAAGIGCAAALRECGVKKLLVLDAKGTGASFDAWPLQMRMLTPSFHAGSFGSVDLNSVTPNTSVADCLHTQHPTGAQYARYLQALVKYHEIQVQAPVKVAAVRQSHQHLTLECSTGRLHARFVIWAVGEYARPSTGGIHGAEHCLHNSRVQDWNALEGESFTIVGGYESGIDAAIHLVTAGKDVTLLSRGEPWVVDDADPSYSLSPRTLDRLREALLHAPGTIRFQGNVEILRVDAVDSGFELTDADERVHLSPTAPILCTGFQHALDPVRHLFAWKKGQPVFDEANDASTITPSFYYSGPALQHRGALFCFIYKYRARFGIIARDIATKLHLPWEKPLKRWRERSFMLEDLSCCADCQCAIPREDDPEIETALHENAR